MMNYVISAYCNNRNTQKIVNGIPYYPTSNAMDGVFNDGDDSYSSFNVAR